MTYPNVLVADYVKKARVANPQILAKAEQYIHVGYQRLLTFEVKSGGFDWCGHGPAVIWLTAYGLQEFHDMKKVYPIDPNLIERTQRWLMDKQAVDGTWSDQHGARWLPAMGDQKLLLTSYVAWSLLETGSKDSRIEKSIQYILDHIGDAKDNAYILALVANALAAWDAKDDRTLDAVRRLEKHRRDHPESNSCSFPTSGQSLCYSTGDSATIETTALAVLALMKTGGSTTTINQAMNYLVKSRDSSGTWGSTQATILSLKALVASTLDAGGGLKENDHVPFSVLINGKEAGKGEITRFNAEVVQLFDLKDHTRLGNNEVAIKVNGKLNMMYQIVGRYWEPWDRPRGPAQPVLDVVVDYDRRELTTAEVLKAKATFRYHGNQPTFMIIVDLAIPPGFAVDPSDFTRMVRQGENAPQPFGQPARPKTTIPVEKVSITSRQVTLYLGETQPGDQLSFEYTLRPRFPVRVQTPATVAYEYYTPANRATTRPIELIVRER